MNVKGIETYETATDHSTGVMHANSKWQAQIIEWLETKWQL